MISCRVDAALVGREMGISNEMEKKKKKRSKTRNTARSDAEKKESGVPGYLIIHTGDCAW